MRHCINLGLVKLSLSRKAEYKDEYYIARYDDSVTPPRVHHFLKDFSLPETPNNRAIYTEYDGYKKIFEIYKEFYMRNMNIEEEEIKKDYEKTKVEEIIEKEKISEAKKPKKTKKEIQEEKLLNFPNRQIDLLEMIEDCEKEKNGSA
jgi:hypothetical protein